MTMPMTAILLIITSLIRTINITMNSNKNRNNSK